MIEADLKSRASRNFQIWITDLLKLGDKGGKLDQLVDDTYTPRTLQNYLGSTRKFFYWLAAGFTESTVTRKQFGVECDVLNATMKSLEDLI